MSTGTKIALACVAFGVLLSALAGEVSGVAGAAVAGFWIWQHQLMRQQRDEAWEIIEHEHTPNVFRVEVPPEHFRDALDMLVRPDTHRATSQGGIRPHLCVCGTPLEDH